MSIHSIDGEPWKTKLDRISELSAGDKSIKFNNLGHLIDISMLKEQYHLLEGNKAVGIDGITKIAYGERLEENLKQLLARIRKGTYNPQPAKWIEIPKEDGSKRPLAIACLEDKLVQSTVNVILASIFEPLFLNCSYGFRPGKSCHDALRALNQSTFHYWDGAIVEIDLRQCFNSISHEKLMGCLSNKISDKRFLRLVTILLKTPTLQGKQVIPNQKGCPQGSILSPILCNIYLHEVIDSWFAQIRQTHLRGKAELIRYCDDMVFVFQRKEDAERFYNVLPKRLTKYELTLHEEKSQLICSGHAAAARSHNQGKRLPTYKFLGFTCYWGKTRNGYWRLKFIGKPDSNREYEALSKLIEEPVYSQENP
ncbi:reverse transcriptase (RNA-directed DNA polymerase) [Legionella nautarum]|uniref:Reverse transcriptase (RNA-directed DNA polymerase) n=1 Tax=Legionella nautarum TaxID=45070 RepID=A0A0W0WKA0_9GAMM|nr:reverse transcriptase domain-containing protein [Legionella nautarum]KTD32719.1 reverse transcriptase (RNA-directed DNA polymerase) [Legionella nautarum]